LLTYETDAHVITQGLGKNENIFPPGVICDGCNRYLGQKVESALVRHPTLAYDMQRLGVPGKDGGPRPILGNWQRESDGSVLVPMAAPQNWQGRPERLDIGLLPILDPKFNQLRFRRGLHMLAFNVLAYLHAVGRLPDAIYDPRQPSYDAIRRYIREPRSPVEAWPFLQRYDRPQVGGKVEVHLLNCDGLIIGRIRAFSFEFYVDLMNTGNLLPWAEAQGITPLTLVAPGVRYPDSPTEDEVPPEERWWLRFLTDGRLWLFGPNGEEIELTPVGPPSPFSLSS
jgi:hypothetical protein